MSVRSYRASVTSAPPRIEIHNPVGRVLVEAVEGAHELEVQVEALNSVAEQALAEVEMEASQPDPDRPDEPVRLRVRVPAPRLFRNGSFAIRVTTPPGAAVRLTVASADAEIRGRMGRLDTSGASGDLLVEQCTELHARGASGDVEVGSLTEGGAVASASGDVRLREVTGDLDVRTASGDISIGDITGTATLLSASGDVEVGGAGRGRMTLKTMSGDAEIGIVPGLRVWLDLASVSGRMNSQLDDDTPDDERSPELSISARTVSGDVRIRRASAVSPAV